MLSDLEKLVKVSKYVDEVNVEKDLYLMDEDKTLYLHTNLNDEFLNVTGKTIVDLNSVVKKLALFNYTGKVNNLPSGDGFEYVHENGSKITINYSMDDSNNEDEHEEIRTKIMKYKQLTEYIDIQLPVNLMKRISKSLQVFDTEGKMEVKIENGVLSLEFEDYQIGGGLSLKLDERDDLKGWEYKKSFEPLFENDWTLRIFKNNNLNCALWFDEEFEVLTVSAETDEFTY